MKKEMVIEKESTETAATDLTGTGVEEVTIDETEEVTATGSVTLVALENLMSAGLGTTTDGAVVKTTVMVLQGTEETEENAGVVEVEAAVKDVVVVVEAEAEEEGKLLLPREGLLHPRALYL